MHEVWDGHARRRSRHTFSMIHLGVLQHQTFHIYAFMIDALSWSSSTTSTSTSTFSNISYRHGLLVFFSFLDHDAILLHMHIRNTTYTDIHIYTYRLSSSLAFFFSLLLFLFAHAGYPANISIPTLRRKPMYITHTHAPSNRPTQSHP